MEDAAMSMYKAQEAKDLVFCHEALNRGIDYVVQEMEPTLEDENRTRSDVFRVWIGLDKGKEGPSMTSRLPAGSNTNINMSPSDLVRYMKNVALSNFTTLLNPLATLYVDSFWAHQRDMAGMPVCQAEFSNDHYALIQAEPIYLCADPRPCDISYDEGRRVLLNGLHSGGKTLLLETMGHYLIAGWSGRWLPAEKVILPRVTHVWHSFKVDQGHRKGKVESELKMRAENLYDLTPHHALFIDEFLQHASEEAAEPLEPAVIEDMRKTGAHLFIITHRGKHINQRKWNIFSPGYERRNGRIEPTYAFHRSWPDESILVEHVDQILEDSEKQMDLSFSNPRDRMYDHKDKEPYWEWYERLRPIVLGGSYAFVS